MLPFLAVLRRLRHGLTLGVRVIATDGEGRVLLVRHSYAAGWHLPGGGVDAGESAEQAARRELAEETGAVVDGPLHLHGVFFNPKVGGRDHVVCYRATCTRRNGAWAPNLEIRAADFFPPDALPDELSPATARRLAEWRQGLAPAHMW